MPTHSVGVTYKTAEGTIASTTDTYTADAEYVIDETIAASTTNKEIDMTLTKANIKSLCLYSDQAVTVNTNSTGAGASDTIVLAAKVQLVWNTDSHFTIPLSPTTVSKFYITNSGGVAANIKFRFLANQAV
jgi:hypothetical protein